MGAPKLSAPQALVLALDVGTSSLRSSLFTERAERIPATTAQLAYKLRYPAGGGAELSPRVLRLAARRCIEQTLAVRRDQSRLRDRPNRAAGISCFWHSMLGVDASFRPVTPIYTWADARCRDDARRLREEVSEVEAHARTGCMLRASYWPAKLEWLRRTSPELLKRVVRWMSPGEWLQHQLAGRATCSLSMASGTGLFDPARLTWDDPFLERFHLEPEMLLPVSDAPVPGAARPFPELRGVPWFPAIGDGASSNLGSGAVRPGLAAINFGTSAALRVVQSTETASAPFGLFCYRVDRRRFLVGGAVSNAGNLRAWCLRELHFPADAPLDRELARRPEPRHGLTILPFWTVERSPTWNEDTPGAIIGMTQNTSALDILQAALEASFHRLALIAERVIGHAGAVPKFIVSGGIQNSTASVRRLANVLGHPVYPNPEKEASLRGAAVFALEQLGVEPPSFVPATVIRPSADIAEIYRADRLRQERLEDRLTNFRA